MADARKPCAACKDTTVTKKKWNNNYYCAWTERGTSCFIIAQSVIPLRKR